MKKKLILVFPVDKSIVRFNAIAPPLGLGIVAALTPDTWDVEICDENFDAFQYKKADLIGITSWSVNINRAYEIAGICKNHQTPVVIGGPHVSALPEEALNYCDFVVKGLAEEVWTQFLSDFENGTAKEIYEGKVTEKFVKPRHDLFHKDYILGAIQTTRGCPLDCDFCHVRQYHGHKYFRKNPDDVVSEMAEIPQKFIFFVDDNFGGFTKQHEDDAILLFDKIIISKLKKYWYSQTSLNIALNDEFLRKARQSGCGSFLIGFEAETEEALLSINKKLNIKLKPSKYNEYINNIQKKGISVIATAIFGLETDTLSSMERRAEYLCNLEASSITSTFLTPFPGTRFYENLKNSGRLIYNNYPNDWKYYNCMYLTIKPLKEAMPLDTYERIIKEMFLKPFHPLRLFLRAVKTFVAIPNLIVLMHSYSTNIKYRRFIKNKEQSFYKLRLYVSKFLYGNRTTIKAAYKK